MKDLMEALNRAHELDDISSRKLKESMNGEESWTDYAARRLDEDPEDFLEDMFAKFVEKAYTLVEAEGYTDVVTEPSTQLGRGGDFFWAEKDGVSYRGNYDFETEQEEMGDCCLDADSEEEAIELCAKKYASIILSSLKPDLEEDLNKAHELDEDVGNEHDVKNLVRDLSSIDGIAISKDFPIRTRKYDQGYRIYVKYIFDDHEYSQNPESHKYAQNLETLVNNGYDKHTILTDSGECVREFMDSAIKSITDKYPNLSINIKHNLWGFHGDSVFDEVTLTVKPA